MNNSKVPPVLSMLSAAGDVFKSRKKFRLIFLYTFVSGIFILIEFVSFITYVFTKGTVVGDISLDIVVTFVLVLGFLLVVLSVPIVYYSKYSVRKFEAFVSNFYPIYLKTEIELFVPGEESLNDSIVSLIKTIDNDFKRASENPNFPKKVIDITKKFDIILKARKKIAAVIIVNDVGNESEKFKDIQLKAIELTKKLGKKSCMLVIVNSKEQLFNGDEFKDLKGLRTIILNESKNGFKLSYLSESVIY